jgi:hypothetical protein
MPIDGRQDYPDATVARTALHDALRQWASRSDAEVAQLLREADQIDDENYWDGLEQ